MIGILTFIVIVAICICMVAVIALGAMVKTIERMEFDDENEE